MRRDLCPKQFPRKRGPISEKKRCFHGIIKYSKKFTHPRGVYISPKRKRIYFFSREEKKQKKT
jgi:hypothetical protein